MRWRVTTTPDGDSHSIWGEEGTEGRNGDHSGGHLGGIVSQLP